MLFVSSYGFVLGVACRFILTVDSAAVKGAFWFELKAHARTKKNEKLES